MRRRAILPIALSALLCLFIAFFFHACDDTGRIKDLSGIDISHELTHVHVTSTTWIDTLTTVHGVVPQADIPAFIQKHRLSRMDGETDWIQITFGNHTDIHDRYRKAVRTGNTYKRRLERDSAYSGFTDIYLDATNGSVWIEIAQD